MNYDDIITWANAGGWHLIVFWGVAIGVLLTTFSIGGRAAEWCLDWSDRRRERRALWRRR